MLNSIPVKFEPSSDNQDQESWLQSWQPRSLFNEAVTCLHKCTTLRKSIGWSKSKFFAIQTRIQSMGYKQGRLSPKREVATHRFQELIMKSISPSTNADA